MSHSKLDALRARTAALASRLETLERRYDYRVGHPEMKPGPIQQMVSDGVVSPDNQVDIHNALYSATEWRDAPAVALLTELEGAVKDQLEEQSSFRTLVETVKDRLHGWTFGSNSGTD